VCNFRPFICKLFVCKFLYFDFFEYICWCFFVHCIVGWAQSSLRLTKSDQGSTTDTVGGKKRKRNRFILVLFRRFTWVGIEVVFFLLHVLQI